MFDKFHLIAAAALTGALTLAAPGAHAADESGDDATTREVIARLHQHGDFMGDGVHVQTIDGVVYLHGQVATDLEGYDAEAVAKSVPNVQTVVNDLAAPSD